MTEKTSNPYPLSLVVAVSRQGIIGDQNRLPWKLSSDLQRFKRLTMGQALLMGRKTYESIGRLLPGRTTIILTRNPNFVVDGAWTAHSLEEAIERLRPAGLRPFVVGGAEIYRASWPLVSHVHRTRVLADVAGDTSLPEFDLTGFRMVECESVPADDRNEWPSVYEHWAR